ncbi:MAG: hypothetical protein GYA51_07585 [Candidatus Methanofastidiosa archaeon]|nr:hypothetical protein [Candidatus Methanofastidiosa archaeon]
MKKIKELKMSLMKKEGDTQEEGKSNFMVKCSATLDIEKYVAEHSVTEEQYDDFILQSSSIIFDELLTKIDNCVIDSVGVWLTFEDGTKIDNSIELSVLKDIEKYGAEDVDPIKEFIKMTLEIE